MDPAALSAAARFVQIVGAATLFGAPLLALSSFRGAAGAQALRLGWPTWALHLSAGLVVAGALVSLGAETASMTGQPGDALRPAALWEVLSGTQFGLGLAARGLMAVLALVAGGPLAPRWRRRVVAGLGAGVLASFAWTGHGAMNDGTGGLIHLIADIIHLLAAGAWLGALTLFAASLANPGLRRDPQTFAALTSALRRFSGLGSIYVAALLLTGLVNGLFLVGLNNVGRATATPYGAALIIKLILFFCMVGLAALNRFVLVPRLQQRGELAALRWSIGFETSLAVAVLGVVAWLGVLPPPSMA